MALVLEKLADKNNRKARFKKVLNRIWLWRADSKSPRIPSQSGKIGALPKMLLARLQPSNMHCQIWDGINNQSSEIDLDIP
ncbi:MAG: hypothetical protein ACJAWV_001626 [Flammeovirgaceae bacterium]|jgi:hypothetical protein